MEGAVRVFAQEYQSATLSVAAPDAGSSQSIVTPGGAWCRLLFIAGALTEVTDSGDMLRCRIADPTGVFELVIGGRLTALSDTVRQIPIPSFVTVSGTAQGYLKNGNLVVTVRPETIQVVDRAVRDRWVLMTAEQSLSRLKRLLDAVNGGASDEPSLTVVRHYALDVAGIVASAGMIENAVQGVRAVVPEPAETVDARQIVMEIIRAGSGPRGMAVQDVLDAAAKQTIPDSAVLAAIESLIVDDECYQPLKGYVKPL